MPTPTAISNSHGERIVALETGQRALQDSLQKLADIVSEQSENQMREHGQTRREIMLLADKVGNVGRPNYGVIIAACSLVCMLVAAVLSPLHFQQQSNSRLLAKVADEFHAHQMLPVHPVAAAVLEEREKAREERDTLQEKLNASQHDLIRLESKTNKP